MKILCMDFNYIWIKMKTKRICTKKANLMPDFWIKLETVGLDIAAAEGCAARWSSWERPAVSQSQGQPCVSQHPTQEICLEMTRSDSVLLAYSEGSFLPGKAVCIFPLGKNPLSQPRGGGLELESWLGEHGVRSKAGGRPRRTFS